MFTPEKEVPSSRFRESTPKTPFGRKKKDYTPEKEVPSSRFKESTPRTPLVRNRKLQPPFDEIWENIEKNRNEVDMHIEQAIREQKNVLMKFENGIETAEEYQEQIELKELQGLLKTETEKYNTLVSLRDTPPIRSQIVVPYSLF